MNIRPLTYVLLTALLAAAAGCHSRISPLQPVERVEVWVPDEPLTAVPATGPATNPDLTLVEPATQPGDIAATAPAQTAPATTQPGRMVVRIIDPNQTSRFIYKADYDNIWQQAMNIFTRTGFAIDRQDYRLGVLTSKPLPSAQVVEFWKPQLASATSALENTVNNQRRLLRLTISRVPGKPEFYEIGIQVLVERLTNPSEQIGGPVFVEGSGFGRNALSLRSDYVEPIETPGVWVRIGHDSELERKLLNELFNRI